MGKHNVISLYPKFKIEDFFVEFKVVKVGTAFCEQVDSETYFEGAEMFYILSVTENQNCKIQHGFSSLKP